LHEVEAEGFEKGKGRKEVTYDSRDDTLKHIAEVKGRLENFAIELRDRGATHDKSKLESPEKPVFDEVTPKLKDLEYGTDEYKDALRELGPALERHYKENSHHPEHYENGISGMDLLDLVEMYCDWAAATLRTRNGDMGKSIETNIERFGIDGPLADVLRNTYTRHGGFSGYKDFHSAGCQPEPEDPAWTTFFDLTSHSHLARRPCKNHSLVEKKRAVRK